VTPRGFDVILSAAKDLLSTFIEKADSSSRSLPVGRAPTLSFRTLNRKPARGAAIRKSFICFS